MGTILLLEDNDDLARMIRQIFEWRGYKVLYGASGEAGIAFLEQAEPLPDFILCDLVMPDMDGLDVLAQARANSAWAAIPFVIMSANATDTDQEMAAACGADGYLVKPFGIAELDAILKRFGVPAVASPGEGWTETSGESAR